MRHCVRRESPESPDEDFVRRGRTGLPRLESDQRRPYGIPPLLIARSARTGDLEPVDLLAIAAESEVFQEGLEVGLGHPLEDESCC